MANRSRPNPALGEVIRRLRKERKLSLEKLAHRSGVSVNTLTGIELRRIDARWSTIEKIARGLRVSVGQLGFEVTKRAATLAREREAEAFAREQHEAALGGKEGPTKRKPGGRRGR